MSQVIDLDAAKAARREASATGVVIRFGGDEFKLPAEMPLDVLDALMELQATDPGKKVSEKQQGAHTAKVMGAMLSFMQALLGDEWAKFRAKRPSFEDLNALIDALMGAYGLDNVGNSGASTTS